MHSDKTKKTVLNYIKLGATRNEAAKKFGVSPGSIQNWTMAKPRVETVKPARTREACPDVFGAILADASIAPLKKRALLQVLFS